MTWTCEAFGIPDVEYAWLKNGEPIYDWKAHQTGEDRTCKRRRQFGSRSFNKLKYNSKTNPGTAVEDRGRYEIKCGNILKIHKVSNNKYDIRSCFLILQWVINALLFCIFKGKKG